LRQRVASIDVLEVDGGQSVVLPSTSVVLGIQYRGRVSAGDIQLAVAGVTGLQSAARTYCYAPGTGSVLVRFTPGGAASLGAPGTELSDRSVPLEALLPAARVAEVQQRLGEAQSSLERVSVVEDFLAQLPEVRAPWLTRALELLTAEGSEARVAEVARALGLCERQFERRFAASVGVSPKRFATLSRFERALSQVHSTRSWTMAALSAGYCDQSHFIREFRRYTGTTPRKFFAK
jgi:AraC-like DNA-binding protein